MKRILVLLAFAGVATLGIATAAQAGVVRNATVTYAYSGWVPCANGGAGELVTGTIEAHLLDTSTVNDNVDASHFMFATRGTLVGRTSGDSYRLSGVEHGSYLEGTNDHSVLTYINRYRLIGAGSAANLIVRETAHITRNGDDVVVQFDDYSIDCG